MRPEILEQGDSRSYRQWENTDAGLPLDRRLSFKHEDEVDGEPIGSVSLVDWERAVIGDYGWMSLREAKDLARSMSVELDEG